jgi:hypothetical protein
VHFWPIPKEESRRMAERMRNLRSLCLMFLRAVLISAYKKKMANISTGNTMIAEKATAEKEEYYSNHTLFDAGYRVIGMTNDSHRIHL